MGTKAMRGLWFNYCTGKYKKYIPKQETRDIMDTVKNVRQSSRRRQRSRRRQKKTRLSNKIAQPIAASLHEIRIRPRSYPTDVSISHRNRPTDARTIKTSTKRREHDNLLPTHCQPIYAEEKETK